MCIGWIVQALGGGVGNASKVGGLLLDVDDFDGEGNEYNKDETTRLAHESSKFKFFHGIAVLDENAPIDFLNRLTHLELDL